MTETLPIRRWTRNACRRIDARGRRLHAAALRRVRSGAPDRGDVPGWVMVTVMTAILVVAILAVFEPEIKTAISSALDSVTGSK
jgi:hypothetical protein